MTYAVSFGGRRAWSRAMLASLCMIVAGGCGEEDRTGPGAEMAGTETGTAAAGGSGIVFASSALTVSQINSVHTGLVETPTPSNILSFLSQLRQKNGRVLIKLAGSENSYKNADGTFSLAKWKTQVDRFRNIDLSSYIADGTIVAHYMVDEPHYKGRWGGRTIPQVILEDAAKHSKLRWPNLPTVVSAPANWLASVPVTYVHLDAAWATYRAKTSDDPAGWIAQQVRRARSKNLGLIAAMNVLDGGDGSSGIRGTQPRTWAMSAAEVKRYGLALLAPSHICAFSMWRYDATYYGRTDVRNAMADLSAKASSHARTSCRQ
jgi:hypothetical protein